MQIAVLGPHSVPSTGTARNYNSFTVKKYGKIRSSYSVSDILYAQIVRSR